MKIREVIEKLQKFDQELELKTESYQGLVSVRWIVKESDVDFAYVYPDYIEVNHKAGFKAATQRAIDNAKALKRSGAQIA